MELLSINEENKTFLVTISDKFKRDAPHIYKLIVEHHLLMTLLFKKSRLRIAVRGNSISMYPGINLPLTEKKGVLLNPLKRHISSNAHLISKPLSSEQYWFGEEDFLAAFPNKTVYLITVNESDILWDLIKPHLSKPRLVNTIYSFNSDEEELSDVSVGRYEPTNTLLYSLIVSASVILVLSIL